MKYFGHLLRKEDGMEHWLIQAKVEGREDQGIDHQHAGLSRDTKTTSLVLSSSGNRDSAVEDNIGIAKL